MLKFLSLLPTLFERGGLHKGRRISLSPARKFVVDYLRYARNVPSQPLVRVCDVRDVNELRRSLPERIGWSAIMIRAYSLLAQRHPKLRRVLMTWPWNHLYEHPHEVCRVAVTRTIDDEECLYFHRIEQPENLSLPEIQKAISDGQTKSIDEVPIFAVHRAFCRLPAILRRPIWWLSMNVSGAWRSAVSGTFGLTTVASMGGMSIHPPTMGNLVLSSAPIQDDGRMRITFVYDHRVHDGNTIAKALKDFEGILHNEMCGELKALQEGTETRIAWNDLNDALRDAAGSEQPAQAE